MNYTEAVRFFHTHYPIWDKINKLFMDGTTTEFIRCMEKEGKRDANDRLENAHVYCKNVNKYFSNTPEQYVSYDGIDSTEASKDFYKHYTIWEKINRLYLDGIIIKRLSCAKEEDKHDIDCQLIVAHAYEEDVMTHFFGDVEVSMHTPEQELTDEEEDLLLAFTKNKFSNYIQHG